MISILYQKQPLPSSFLANQAYELEIQLSGIPPLFASWTIYTQSETISSGNGAQINFVPLSAQTYYINVLATSSDGSQQEQVFTIQVTNRRSGVSSVYAVWQTLTASAGDTLSAQINFVDPEGLRPLSISWVLLRNFTQVGSGTSLQIQYPNAVFGFYALQITAVDITGATVYGQSSVVVQGGFEVQSSLQPDPVSGTLQYLGSVYTFQCNGGGGSITSLPAIIGTMSQELFLLPGTTHFTVALDSASGVDDVVARTFTGNWAAVGPPSGLSGQALAYDYTLGQPYVPAPADLRTKITVDAYKVSGTSFGPYSFRVQISCYRLGPVLYEYTACPYSQFIGGTGPRSRRLVAIPSQATVFTDGQQSLYTTPEVTEIPATLLPTGQPDLINPNTSTSFTEANLVCTYEPEQPGLEEIDVKATFGLPGFKPSVLTLTRPANPPIISTVQGLSGNLNFYLADGVLNPGAVITATISAPHIPTGYVVRLPITQNYFSPDCNTFVNIGYVPISLNDLEFDRFGLVISFVIDESGVGQVSVPTGSLPVPQGANPTVFSTVYGTNISYDSALYSNPVPQVEFTTGVFAESAVTTPIAGCYAEGPAGLYCYSDLATGSLTVQFPQPYMDPAPYIAYATNPGYCYGNPVLISTGSLGTLPTNLPNVTVFSNNEYCGTFYAYVACDNSLPNVVVSYPANTSPHSFLEFSNHAWSLLGMQSNPGTLPWVPLSEISPLASCSDPYFTGSNPAGSSVPYLDYETGGTVAVNFPNLGQGIPFFGVAAQDVDPGLNNLSAGLASVMFTNKTRSATVINQVQGNGNLVFSIAGAAVGYAKSFCVQAPNGNEVSYALPASAGQVAIPVSQGQKIKLVLQAALPGKMVLAGIVRWTPAIVLPRLFDTQTLSFSGSAIVEAVGFTGLTNRTDYQLYEQVPADVDLEAVNPDSIVTVQDAVGAEQVLIRCRAVGENVPALPAELAWYAGNYLFSPLTFRFYAGRALQGAHGEMDVWLSAAGNFPAYLSASPYKALVLPGWAYPKNSSLADTSRNSLRVIPNQSVLETGYFFPCVYTSSAGDQIVVAANSYPNTISVNGTNYGFTEIALGLAYSIDTVQFEDATNYLITESGLYLLTETGEFLETELQ